MAIFSKLKQIKDLRAEAKKLKNTMSQETVHGKGSGGKVGVVMDGNQEILNLDIADELLTPARKDELIKGVIAALGDANKQLQQIMAKKVRSGEVKLPDLGGS